MLEQMRNLSEFQDKYGVRRIISVCEKNLSNLFKDRQIPGAWRAVLRKMVRSGHDPIFVSNVWLSRSADIACTFISRSRASLPHSVFALLPSQGYAFANIMQPVEVMYEIISRFHDK